MQPIRIYGDPVLRRKAKAVETFDQQLERFAAEMSDVMRQADGVGLAAPQVGESVRVVVVDASGGERDPFVLVNPEIVWSSEEKEDYDEGCLSVPGITLTVNRPSRVTVKAFDQHGRAYTIENADGLLARALQHEIDHLDGILFVDRVSPLQRQLINGKLKRLAKGGRESSEAA